LVSIGPTGTEIAAGDLFNVLFSHTQAGTLYESPYNVDFRVSASLAGGLSPEKIFNGELRDSIKNYSSPYLSINNSAVNSSVFLI
jgi:hypothetical protein